MAFIDSEGEPWQELSCVMLSLKEKRIVAVYHQYAACPPFEDEWARLHLHGLNPRFLMKHGFPDEASLVTDFKVWLQPFEVIGFFANDPQRELDKLNIKIHDIHLPKWVERYDCEYHHIPQLYKMSNKPFHGIVCNNEVHCDYVYQFIRRCRTPSAKVKALHGFHCSLADAHELCLYYMKMYL